MKVAATSGGLGDIVYSILIMRELGVGTVYVKESWFHHPYHSLYSAIRGLLTKEGFDVLPTSGDYKVGKFEKGLKYDFNLDSFRKQPKRGQIHIQTNLRNQFKLPHKPYEPWLHYAIQNKGYNLIQLTNRWRDNSKVDWKKIAREIPRPVYFVGFQYEWLEFIYETGVTDIEWKKTDDILDMTALIAGCNNLYCNQSVALTIAQGLNKPYYLEVKPGKTNTLLYIPNENILT